MFYLVSELPSHLVLEETPSTAPTEEGKEKCGQGEHLPPLSSQDELRDSIQNHPVTLRDIWARTETTAQHIFMGWVSPQLLLALRLESRALSGDHSCCDNILGGRRGCKPCSSCSLTDTHTVSSWFYCGAEQFDSLVPKEGCVVSWIPHWVKASSPINMFFLVNRV